MSHILSSISISFAFLCKPLRRLFKEPERYPLQRSFNDLRPSFTYSPCLTCVACLIIGLAFSSKARQFFPPSSRFFRKLAIQRAEHTKQINDGRFLPSNKAKRACVRFSCNLGGKEASVYSPFFCHVLLKKFSLSTGSAFWTCRWFVGKQKCNKTVEGGVLTRRKENESFAVFNFVQCEKIPFKFPWGKQFIELWIKLSRNLIKKILEISILSAASHSTTMMLIFFEIAARCGALNKPTSLALYSQVCLTLRGHSLPVRTLDISSDSMRLASGADDKTVRVWGLQFGDCHTSFHGHESAWVAFRRAGSSTFTFLYYHKIDVSKINNKQ